MHDRCLIFFYVLILLKKLRRVSVNIKKFFELLSKVDHNLKIDLLKELLLYLVIA